MADEISEEKRQRKLDAANFGLVCFKLAQIIWQNAGGKMPHPKPQDYLPNVKVKQQSQRELREAMEAWASFINSGAQ